MWNTDDTRTYIFISGEVACSKKRVKPRETKHWPHGEERYHGNQQSTQLSSRKRHIMYQSLFISEYTQFNQLTCSCHIKLVQHLLKNGNAQISCSWESKNNWQHRLWTITAHYTYLQFPSQVCISATVNLHDDWFLSISLSLINQKGIFFILLSRTLTYDLNQWNWTNICMCVKDHI